ncbi:SAM-dependent methyltransferase [Ignicoccus pacificus DSM 13166]|uniref:SAM-dependent methyltransferase n=1 Tax=Ignicoccus pacificus DSM 13166 TaxID=940294 RepID=A0A977PKC3_9CREN|nr:SAM-dependent methyltransferase [Ignicoccus pacificus DSM 13166]
MKMSFEVFSQVAEEYDKWYEEKEEIYKKELKCVKKGIQGKRILEVGGGTGAFSSPLGAVNLDPALGALKVAKRKDVEAILGIAEMLPFRSNSFDSSFFVTSLCFVNDVKKALKEAERVSKSVVACIIPKESGLAKKYEERGRKGHPIYKYSKFLSKDQFKDWGKVCDLEWFACFKYPA